MFKSPICKKFYIAMHNFQGSHDGETKQHAFYTRRIFLTINYKFLIDAHTLYILQ